MCGTSLSPARRTCGREALAAAARFKDFCAFTEGLLAQGTPP